MAALDEHAGVRFTSDIARDAQTSKAEYTKRSNMNCFLWKEDT